MKRLISLLLCVVMALCTFPLTVLAEDADIETAGEATGELSLTDSTRSELEIDGGLGGLVSNSLAEQEQEEVEDESDTDICNKILKVTIEEKTATVVFNNSVDCRIIVAIYDENTQYMKGSGIAEFRKDAGNGEINIDVEQMPEFFVVKAYLLDLDNQPLHRSYESIEYTQAHREFLNSTIDDYADKNVISFDNDRKNNFAVFKAETVILCGNSTQNTIISSNNDTGTFVFSNADQTVKGLKADDCVYYSDDDGRIIAGKIKEVISKDDTVTVVTDKNSSLDDIFETVKINTTNAGSGTEVDTNGADAGVSYDGYDVPQPSDDTNLSFDNSHKWSISNKNDENVEIKGEVSISTSMNITLQFYSGYCVFETSIKERTAASVSISGKYKKTHDLGTISIPVGIGDLCLAFDVNIVFDSTAEIGLEYSELTTVGMRFDSRNGKAEDISVPTKSDSTVKTEGKVFVGIEVEAKADAIFGCIEIAIPFNAGIEIVGQVSEVGITDRMLHSCDVCIDGAVNVILSVSAKYSINLVVVKWTDEVQLMKLTVKLFDYYISEGQFHFGDCPNCFYMIDFCVTGDDGRSLSDVSVSRNAASTEAPSDNVSTNTKTDINGHAVLFCRKGENIVMFSKDGYDSKTEQVDVEQADLVCVSLGIIEEIDANYGPVYQKGQCGDDVYYIWYTCGVVVIKGTGAMYDYNHISSPFSQSDKVKKVIIKDGVTSIGTYAFFESSVEAVDFPEKMQRIGASAFAVSNIQSCVIPEGVTVIEDFLFQGANVKSVVIPDGVTSIQMHAFHGSDIENITIPKSMSYIGYMAFKNCYGLTRGTVYYGGGSTEWNAINILNRKTDNVHLHIAGKKYNCEMRLEQEDKVETASVSAYASAKIPTYAAEMQLSSGSSERLSDMVAGANYVLIVLSAYEDDFEISTDSLLYITDTVADENGNVELEYYIDDVPFVLFIYGACAHEASDWLFSETSTCEDSTKHTKCTKCGEVLEHEFVPATGHAYSRWEIRLPSAEGNTGVKVKICRDCNKEAESEFVADGDADGDGMMTSSDITVLLRYFAGCDMSGYHSFDVLSLDVTADGVINNRDAIAMIQLTAGWTVDRSLTFMLDGNFDARGIEYILDSISMTATVKGAGEETLPFSELIIPCRVLADGHTYLVTSIAERAFYGRTDITSVYVCGNNVRIGSRAFQGCSALTAVRVDDLGTWLSVCFENYTANPLYVAGDLYIGGELAEKLVVPEEITELKPYALFGCSASSLTLHSGVVSIGDYALYGLGIGELILPEGVESIGENAFRNCDKLESISVPKSLKSIGKEAFYGCSALNRVQIASLYAWCKIDFAHYTANPTYYAKHLYVNGKEMTSVTITANIGSIKNYTFIGCTGLKTIKIADGVTSIGEYAFYGCKGATNVTIASSVTSIGKYAFRGCSVLGDVVIPESVTLIGADAFYNCPAVTLHVTSGSAAHTYAQANGVAFKLN